MPSDVEMKQPHHGDGDRILPDRFCVGPSTAADWGDDSLCITRRLLTRTSFNFVPYRRAGKLALVYITAAAGIGLVPTLMTDGVIEVVARPICRPGSLILLVGAGVGAAVAD